MATPENSFIAGVHRHVECYAEKMCNPYRGGTPDVWYSGSHRDLWVEYKFIALPARNDTFIVPALSCLQTKWIKDRQAEGRNAAIVVGTKTGGCILSPEIAKLGISCADFKSKMKSKKDIASFISNFVNS